MYICKYINIHIYIYIPVVPARGGAEVAFDSIYRTCTRRAPCVLALRELVALLLSKNVAGVRPRCNATSSEHFLHTSHCALHRKKFISTNLSSSARQKTLTDKACTKYFLVLLRTTKLAQSTSQYCFVPQSLHKVLPSTTSYYKACTKYFPVLLRTTKLGQGTSQYYFVLQSIHKELPSTILRTTKLAQGTSQYYFVHLRTTKLAQRCTKYFPVLLRTTKLAHSTSQYYFVLQSLRKVLPSTTSY